MLKCYISERANREYEYAYLTSSTASFSSSFISSISRMFVIEDENLKI